MDRDHSASIEILIVKFRFSKRGTKLLPWIMGRRTKSNPNMNYSRKITRVMKHHFRSESLKVQVNEWHQSENRTITRWDSHQSLGTLKTPNFKVKKSNRFLRFPIQLLHFFLYLSNGATHVFAADPAIPPAKSDFKI